MPQTAGRRCWGMLRSPRPQDRLRIVEPFGSFAGDCLRSQNPATILGSMSADTPLPTRPSASILEHENSRTSIRLVIDAHDPIGGLSVRSLLRYADLLSILAARDLAVRYRQAVVGIGWAILRPAASVAIFVVLFTLLNRQPTTVGLPYAATALVGVLAWQLFATLVTDMSESLVRSRSILTKIYFPRVLIPLAATAVGLTDYVVALLPSIVVLQILGAQTGWAFLLLPFWVSGIVLAAVAAGVGLSGLNARYRDVGHLVPFLLQMGFFLCPVIYASESLIPDRWRWLYALNPLATLLDGLRWSLIGAPPPSLLATVAAGGLISSCLLFAWRLFHGMDRDLAERI